MDKIARFNNYAHVCIPNYRSVACCVLSLCLVRTDLTPMNTANRNESGGGVGVGAYRQPCLNPAA